MAIDSESPQSLDVCPLTDDQAVRLLGLGLSKAPRPVERLINRLNEPEAEDWWSIALTTTLDTVEPLLDSATPVEQLAAFKDRCTCFARDAEDDEGWLQGMAGYFVSIAAALAHHDKRISTRSYSEISRTLADLAKVLADPWSGLFTRAADSADRLAKLEDQRSDSSKVSKTEA